MGKNRVKFKRGCGAKFCVLVFLLIPIGKKYRIVTNLKDIVWRQILCVGIFFLVILFVLHTNREELKIRWVAQNFVHWFFSIWIIWFILRCYFWLFKSFASFCVRILMNQKDGVVPNFVCWYFSLFESFDSLYMNFLHKLCVVKTYRAIGRSVNVLKVVTN